MAQKFATFNIRYEKTQCKLKVETPVDMSTFIEKLKKELKVKETEELIILCPTTEGKMMQIQSDSDIEYLQEHKLCYNAVSKEIHCSVEIVVQLVHKQLPDDPKVQIMILSDKLDLISSQLDEISQSFNNKIKESESSILNNIRKMLSEQSLKDSNNTSKISLLGEQNNDKVSANSFHKKKVQKDKERSSGNSSITSATNDNSSNSPENLNQQKKCANTDMPNDIDTLLDMLVKNGFTNTIQNIIVLKRFDHDYEKAVNYLKSSNT